MALAWEELLIPLEPCAWSKSNVTDLLKLMNELLLEHRILDFCTLISIFWQHSCCRWKSASQLLFLFMYWPQITPFPRWPAIPQFWNANWHQYACHTTANLFSLNSVPYELLCDYVLKKNIKQQRYSLLNKERKKNMKYYYSRAFQTLFCHYLFYLDLLKWNQLYCHSETRLPHSSEYNSSIIVSKLGLTEKLLSFQIYACTILASWFKLNSLKCFRGEEES